MRDLLNGLPEINSLTLAQENKLATSCNPDDKSILVLSAMREAFFYAKQCCRSKLPEDEVFSSCFESLSHAAKNFKPDRIRFLGYAKPYVRGGLSKVWRSKDVVRNKKGEWHDELSLRPPRDGGEAETEDADGLTGVILRRNMMESAPICNPEIDSIQLREEYEIIKPMFKQLTDKEQSVIVLRYRSGFTFERIGALLGTSPADSQVTHARALKKLRRLVKHTLGTIK